MPLAPCLLLLLLLCAEACAAVSHEAERSKGYEVIVAYFVCFLFLFVAIGVWVAVLFIFDI